MRKNLLTTGIILTTCLAPSAAQAASFTGLNIFGDSLVDSGNFFTLTSALAPFGFPALPPSPPYNQRSTNGALWIDNLGQALGLSPTPVSSLLTIDPLTLTPSLNLSNPLPTEGINFGFFGSLSSDAHTLDDVFPPLSPLLPGFQEQLATFAALTPVIPVDPTALNVIWVGANDYIDVFFNELTAQPPLGGLSLEVLTNQVTDNIVSGVAALSSLGAKEFLVVNLPPLGTLPAADFLAGVLPRDISAELNQLSTAHNFLLDQKLTALQAALPTTKITQLDVEALIQSALTNPGQFGFTNVSESCLINFTTGFIFEGICDNPDEFLFWDDVHPTAAAHRQVSELALVALAHDRPSADVPEPAAMLGLLALAGWGIKTQYRHLLA